LFKNLVISIVVLPILLGVLTATNRRGPRTMSVLVAVYVVYCAFFVFLLHFLYYRWGAL
jgi:hypothetical protein